MADDNKKINDQKELINLLLRNKEIVNDWSSSLLGVDYFDPRFRNILNAIVDAFSNDVLLTRKSYIEFLRKYNFKKQQIMSEEVLYNGINSLSANISDFPMLSENVLSSYLLDNALTNIHKFGENRKSKNITYAISELADNLQSLVHNVAEGDKIIFENVKDYAKEFYQYLQDIKSGKIEREQVITCGISEIDYTMEIGFAPGTLALICADVGAYKSTLMLNIAANVWRKSKRNVLFVPLEMPRRQMFQKFISRETEIPFDILQKPEKMNDAQMEKVKDEISTWDEVGGQFFMMECFERTKVSTIHGEIRKHIDIFKPDLVVIDYIANLIPDHDRQNRNDLEIGDMLKDLRTMGRKMEFSVVSGAQLGREALRRMRRQSADKVASYSEDVRGSHEYSADADFIFVLMPDPQQASSLVHLTVVKSRYGKKIFQDGRSRAALEVRPEISLIRSREEMMSSVEPGEILERTQDNDLDFDED